MLEIVSYRRMVHYERFYRDLLWFYRMYNGDLRVNVSDDLVCVPDTMLLSIQKHVETLRYVYPSLVNDLPYGHNYPPQSKLDIYYQMFYADVFTVRFTLVVSDKGSYRLYTSVIDYDDPHLWRYYCMDIL